MFGSKHRRRITATPAGVQIGTPAIVAHVGAVHSAANAGEFIDALRRSLPSGFTLPAADMARIVSAAVEAEQSRRVVMHMTFEINELSIAAYSFESISNGTEVNAKWRAAVGSVTATATNAITTNHERTHRVAGIKTSRKRWTETHHTPRGLTPAEIEHVHGVVFAALEASPDFKAIADVQPTIQLEGA